MSVNIYNNYKHDKAADMRSNFIHRSKPFSVDYTYIDGRFCYSATEGIPAILTCRWIDQQHLFWHTYMYMHVVKPQNNK